MLCCLIPVVDYCTRAPVENAEILVSACKDPIVVNAVPDGETLWVHEIFFNSHYFLNLRTGEKEPVPEVAIQLFGSSGWKLLAPDVVLLVGMMAPPGIANVKPYQIFSLSDGMQYPLIDIGAQINVYSPDGSLNPELVNYFQTADRVFVYRDWNVAVALAPNFSQHPDRNVILHQSYINAGPDQPDFQDNGQFLDEFLKTINVEYQVVDVKLINGEIPSPLSTYVIRSDGVYIPHPILKVPLP